MIAERGLKQIIDLKLHHSSRVTTTGNHTYANLNVEKTRNKRIATNVRVVNELSFMLAISNESVTCKFSISSLYYSVSKYNINAELRWSRFTKKAHLFFLNKKLHNADCIYILWHAQQKLDDLKKSPKYEVSRMAKSNIKYWAKSRSKWLECWWFVSNGET